MKCSDQLKAGMEAGEQSNPLKEMNRLSNESGFTAGALKSALAEIRKKE